MCGGLIEAVISSGKLQGEYVLVLELLELEDRAWYKAAVGQPGIAQIPRFGQIISSNQIPGYVLPNLMH